MLETPLDWQSALGLLLLLTPLCYALAAALPTAPGKQGVNALWKRARLAAGASLALAFAAAVGLAFTGESVYRGLTLLPLDSLGTLTLSVRLDVVTVVMHGLVCFVGFFIVRFSRAYLDGDHGQARYVRWLMATLSAVTLLVVANNLLLLAIAWVATSLALHQLLTFYADRPAALVAAHKKFLASRVADLCLLGAVALVGLSLGSLELDEIFRRIETLDQLPTALHAASLLLVASAVLKSAQLPFHGWLIQVMEAPTPVSALLHAGIVNIGGFLMIRLAPLMTQAELAQTLLVAIGSLTAVVGALVMVTRVSVKVNLAWSTCAQMGFMLMQCGLGAYPLALLHLVGHSLYKAHAFLSSGSAVEQWRAHALAPAARPAGILTWLVAAAAALLGVAAVAGAFGVTPQQEPALWTLAAIVSLALTPLAVRGMTGGWLRLALLGAGGVVVAALYFGWHALFSQMLPAVAPEHAPPAPALAIVLGSFGLLYLLYATMSAYPHGRLARALYPRLFAGLYLDELFTRVTFRLWPPRLPEPKGEPLTRIHHQEA